MAREPKAEVEVSAHSRGLKAQLRAARAKFSAFGSELKKNVFGKDLVEKGFWSKAGAEMVGNLGARAASAIGSVLVDQARDVYAFEDSLTRLRIASGKTPEEMRAFADEIRRTSSDVGLNASEILAGAHAYVALTGDMDGATKQARVFARVAQATGSTVADIAQTAAALKQQQGILPEDMERTLGGLAAQGKAGAIELKDLAAQMSTIAPQWAQFAGGRGVRGVQELGAALQIVKRGFGGDAGETITGLQSFLSSLIQHSKQLKKMGGVEVFTKNASTGKMELRNVLDIVDDLANSKLMKNPTKLKEALGRVEAYRAFIQLRENRQELDRIVQVSTDGKLIQRDLDTYLQSTAGRTKKAFQEAKNSIAAAFTPERIEAFANAIIFLIDKLAKIVGFLDKVVTTADKIVNAPKNDAIERGRVAGHRYIVDKFNGQNKAEAAQAAFTEAARLQMAMENGGWSGSRKFEAQGKIDSLREHAQKFREESDLWSATGDNAKDAEKRRVLPNSGLSPEQQQRAQSFLLQAGIKDLKTEIATAIREGLAEAKNVISIGADPVATATKKAPQNARRPGA